MGHGTRRGKASTAATTDTTQSQPGQYAYLNEVAYVIEDHRQVRNELVTFHRLEVRKTANAWWKEQVKVELFITCKRMGANDAQACYGAGITPDQLRNFLAVHPHFREYFAGLSAHPKLTALRTITEHLHDPDMAKWYAERTMKDDFSPRQEHALTGDITEEQRKQSAEAVLRTMAHKAKVKRHLPS